MGSDLLYVLACQYNVAFFHINVIGEVLVYQAGFEAYPGSEETYVYGFAPGIGYGTNSGPVKELYKGRECVHVVSDVCETV